MKNVESMPVYEPTQSHHTQVGKCYYEYNGRLHKANLRTQLFPGYSRFCLGNDGEDAANFVTKMICTVDIDNTPKAGVPVNSKFQTYKNPACSVIPRLQSH